MFASARVPILIMTAVVFGLAMPGAMAASKDKRFSQEVVFKSFADRIYQPDYCGRRCRNEGANCVAWTYEGPRPGAPIGSTSSCRLLRNIGLPFVTDTRYVSALAETALPGDRDNQCVNILPVGFPLYVPERVSVPNPGLCEKKCNDLPTCRAWTYHKFLTGPGSPPGACSLTGETPPTFSSSPGCLSGVK